MLPMNADQNPYETKCLIANRCQLDNGQSKMLFKTI